MTAPNAYCQVQEKKFPEKGGAHYRCVAATVLLHFQTNAEAKMIDAPITTGHRDKLTAPTTTPIPSAGGVNQILNRGMPKVITSRIAKETSRAITPATRLLK